MVRTLLPRDRVRTSTDPTLPALPILAALIVFTLAIAFKLHISSIGIWDKVSKITPPRGVVLGEPRGIRSDEWMVATGWSFAQAHANPSFPRANPEVGYGDSTLLTDLPVAHAFTIFRPHQWGYLLLGAERGLSWSICFRAIGTVLGLFLLLWLVTDGALFLSLLGAVWIYYSTFVQWWFSNILSECLVYSLLAFAAAGALLRAKSLPGILIAAGLFCLFSTGFAFCLYPAFQVPLAYVLGACALTVVVSHENMARLAVRPKLKIASLVVAGAATIAAVGAFALSSWPTISVMLATAYPGARTMRSGDGSVLRLLSGIFDPLTHEDSFPLTWGNVCEASSFLMLWPIALLQIALGSRSDRTNLLRLAPLLAILLVLTAWQLVPLPALVGKVTLLNQVAPNRVLVGIGIASSVLSLAAVRYGRPIPLGRVWHWAPLVCMLAIGLYFAAPAYLDLQGLHIAPHLAFAQAAFALVSTVGILTARLLPLAIGLIGGSIAPNLLVNPIAQGADPLLRAPLVLATQRTHHNAPDAGWLVYDSSVVSQMLLANGYKVLGGVRYLPNLEFWKRFDPAGKYLEAYNRYAHVQFAWADADTEPRFELLAPDMLVVHIHACAPQLADAGITYFLFSNPAQAKASPCLTVARRKSSLPGGYTLAFRREGNKTTDADID